jgi:hypothetical protein
MPIVVSHNPPMELLARAGWYVGAGEDRQRQEEMEQRERMQMRGLEANLISQQLSYQQQMQRDAYGAQIESAQMQQRGQQQAELMRQQEEMQQRAAQIRQEDRNEALLQRTKMQNELATSRFKDQTEWDQAKFFFSQSDDITGDISAQLTEGMGFETPEQENAYRAGLAEMDRVRKEPSLRPIQKAQALYELSSRLPIPTKRIPTTREQMNEQIIMRPDPNDPSKMIEWTIDRNGLPSVAREPDLPKPQMDPEFEREQAESKAYNDAFKLLTKSEKTLSGNKTIPPSHEEVVAFLDKQKEYVRGQAGAGTAKGKPQQGKPKVKRMKFDPATGQLTEVK